MGNERTTHRSCHSRCYWGAGCGEARKTSDTTSHIIPAFSGTTYDGRTVSLDTYRGKPLILIFWASW